MIVTPNLRVQAAEGVLALVDHLCMKNWYDVYRRVGVRQVHDVALVSIEPHYPRKDTTKISYVYIVDPLLEVLCGPEVLAVTILSWDHVPWYVINGHDQYGNRYQYRQVPNNDFVALRMELDLLRDPSTSLNGRNVH